MDSLRNYAKQIQAKIDRDDDDQPQQLEKKNETAPVEQKTDAQKIRKQVQTLQKKNNFEDPPKVEK